MKHSSISVNPDDRHILSATDTEAILLGQDDDDASCILHVSRDVYFQAMTAWLDHKADYMKRWDGEFCGVGNIYFDGSLVKDQHGWLNSVTFGLKEPPDDIDDEAWNHKTKVETYTAEEFDIDMEHG